MRKNKTKQLKERNKPLSRVKWMFIIMFGTLSIYICAYVFLYAPDDVLNSYNKRLDAIENKVVRGDIVDSKGNVLATTVIEDDQVSRVYPYNNLYAQTVGYTGYGKTGLEAYSYLDLIDTNSNFFESTAASILGKRLDGNKVVTTFDTDLQLLAREALGNNRGAIVALEPKTGKILAMVSTPDYDPNTIATDYEVIAGNSDDAALLNRATQGLYPPGSTYKIITTVAYLESHTEEEFFYYCMGEDYINQKLIHCYNSKAHGRMSLKEAFALSCNTSYAHIGETLDVDRLNEISTAMGYNTIIDLEIESNPSQFILDSTSSKSEISETAIGQGKTLVTPIHSAMIVSSIANEGVAMKPYMVDRVLDDEGNVVEERSPEVYGHMLTSDMVELLESYMKATSEVGTAKSLDVKNYEIASKTGSAENPFGDAHAWYVGYAPIEDPKIVLAIVVENVGSSSVNAVPIANELYKSYLDSGEDTIN